ncbi:MAG TPA: hypothetical protein VKV80_17465 [Streptosporangiaceae bacterium]|nr:hypothetical protein [Streptosporangiaceae bacterium]
MRRGRADRACRRGEGHLGQGPGTGHGATAASRAVTGPPSRAGAGGPRFVVQKHGARGSRHDSRLEGDGVLTPWAVPKGPPSGPAEKVFAAPPGASRSLTPPGSFTCRAAG